MVIAAKPATKLIFLDLDGLVCDFVSGALAANKIEDSESILSKMKGSYNIHAILGLPANDFWRAITQVEDFWCNLVPTDDAHEIMNEVESVAPTQNIFFLSSPSLDPKCHSGKIMWVNRHFPKYTRQTILTSHKHLLAGNSRVLIDDSDSNVESFKKAGGRAILYPRPWNSRYTFSGREEALSLFKKELRRFK